MPELQPWLKISLALILVIIFIAIVLLVITRLGWTPGKNLGEEIGKAFQRLI